VVEEHARDGHGGVGMPERNEVRVLGEMVDDRQYDGLAAHPREAFHEIHRYVRPDAVWNVQGLQQPGRMEVLRLVALAHLAGFDEVPHETIGVRVVEGGA